MTPNLPRMETLTEERPPAPRVAESPPAPAARSTPVALLVAMRPSEWIKNLLVFAGLLFSQKLDQSPQVVDAAVTFVAFCAISSAGYLFNDLRDAPLDRRHPEKRRRPIASGALAPTLALVSAASLPRITPATPAPTAAPATGAPAMAPMSVPAPTFASPPPRFPSAPTSTASS